MNQAEVLEYMQEHETATTAEVEANTEDTASGAYYKLEGLAKKGYVKVQQGAEGKTHIYELTETGRTVDPDIIRPVTL